MPWRRRLNAVIRSPLLDRMATGLIQTRLMMRQIGRPRLMTTAGCLFVALLLAAFSWSLPLLGAAERGLYDLRAWIMAPVVDQDDRVVLVVFDEGTVKATGRRSPVDRGVLARALTRLDRVGAKSIGVDILFDQAQHEDAALEAALSRMKTPVFLGFASKASNPENIDDEQEAFESGFLSQVEGRNRAVSRASVRVEPDFDTVLRHWPRAIPGDPPLLSLSVAHAHPDKATYTGAIRWRRLSPSSLAPQNDNPLYVRFPIQLLDRTDNDDQLRRLVAGKYVLVGAQLSDSDRKKTPATLLTFETTPGLEIHADMVAQALDHDYPPLVPPWILALATCAVVGGGALTGLLRTKLAWTPIILGGQLLLWIMFPPLAHRLKFDTQTVPQFGWLVAWLIAYISAAAAARSVGADQRRFAQLALGKVLPADVAEEILRDPSQLALHGDRRRIYALFTDLEGFTALSHAHQPEVIASLLNGYLDLVSRTVLAHGGTVDKFVGDAVVAFWGAPLSREDDGERAVKAALAIWHVGEAFRQTPPGSLPALGRTRVGVHFGDAVVGNFGGEVRIQYTALGDVMNTAARLEGANKRLKTRMLISSEVLESVPNHQLRPMGHIVLRGRSTPVEVHEHMPEFPAPALERLRRSYTAFEGGDLAALDSIRTLAEEFPGDLALANLVDRLKTVGPGGAFDLS